MAPARSSSSADLHDALLSADVLRTYDRLPAANQDQFSSWIEHSHDDESRWRRINALVLALRMAPLGFDNEDPQDLRTEEA
jgi:hypothetical protein